MNEWELLGKFSNGFTGKKSLLNILEVTSGELESSRTLDISIDAQLLVVYLPRVCKSATKPQRLYWNIP
ncbi:MAG: hypothetical protein HEQ20_15980 [Aphanizomenon flos-aquae KM1D3_PB]|jgi:hypothetical protein|uniref:hypothetical protein n=1 Tax=Aphanizomenon flos-aquae TaxID=1176 RepID=UPI000543DD4D|nr:hypothetical protein [Aphanizomenon flos-aquae]KHG41356.1 hypothetical protein OA07_11895 [Aphanizomenon flos-aquae 2012/KM1/D3]QSV71975.1 MAG: hypothetical protein HEQ20_15980 [Aphanizomenon flos-aquae KM1D3_PB]